MTWNYRVVHHRLERIELGHERDADPPLEREDSYEIHEVYYSDAGAVTKMTVAPVPVYAETVEGIRTVLDRMREALDKPVLEYDMQYVDDWGPDPDDEGVA
jgi:hypothetical protein